MEDAHSHKKDIVLCYLDFKGAFPSTDHKHMVRILEFLGLPSDFTRMASNLYSGATKKNIPLQGSHLTGGDPTGDPPGGPCYFHRITVRNSRSYGVKTYKP